MSATAPSQAMSLQQVRQPPAGEVTVVNMFSTQGFALAQRIAQAYMTSNAVPAPFRAVTIKREKQGNDYVDVEIPNPSAMGNCLVAIETAQAVGMSIVAVMQNANVIEGQLRWSGKFIIAAINASRRFTPLRFHIIDHGLITAKYKEKGQWNRDQRRFDMIEREAHVNNLECIAWTLPYGMAFPQGVHTLDQAKTAGLPVIESAPVSMKMAVEEGWYSKPGSKWQGEMKHLMLQYRAGSFFGNIHAPDIVMGMGGQSAEEAQDIIDAKVEAGVMQVDVEGLRNTAAQAAQAQRATAVSKDQHVTDLPSKDIPAQEVGRGAPSNGGSSQHPDDVDVEQLEARLQGAKDLDMLDADADLIRDVADDAARQRLEDIYQARRQALTEPAPETTARPATRRRMAAPE